MISGGERVDLTPTQQEVNNEIRVFNQRLKKSWMPADEYCREVEYLTEKRFWASSLTVVSDPILSQANGLADAESHPPRRGRPPKALQVVR